MKNYIDPAAGIISGSPVAIIALFAVLSMNHESGGCARHEIFNTGTRHET